MQHIISSLTLIVILYKIYKHLNKLQITNQIKNMADTKSYGPTYLSVPKLELLIEKISKLSLKKIDKSTIQTIGLTGTDVSLGIATLNFLGLINDSDNTTTEVMRVFQSMDSQKRSEGIAAVIKQAYKDLYAVNESIHSMPRNDIAESLRIAYGISQRVAISAAPAFMYLCQISGLREIDAESQRRNKSTKKSPTKTKLQKNITPSHEVMNQNEVPTTLSNTAKNRILEGVGWRVNISTDFVLTKEIRQILLELEDSLEKLSISAENETGK